MILALLSIILYNRVRIPITYTGTMRKPVLSFFLDTLLPPQGKTSNSSKHKFKGKKTNRLSQIIDTLRIH